MRPAYSVHHVLRPRALGIAGGILGSLQYMLALIGTCMACVPICREGNCNVTRSAMEVAAPASQPRLPRKHSRGDGRCRQARSRSLECKARGVCFALRMRRTVTAGFLAPTSTAVLVTRVFLQLSLDLLAWFCVRATRSQQLSVYEQIVCKCASPTSPAPPQTYRGTGKPIDIRQAHRHR